MPTPFTVEQIRELIHSGEIVDPLVFLESIMQGQDVRRASSLQKLILKIDAATDGYISKDDWEDIIDEATFGSNYGNVELSASLLAGKTLAEYLHPKRKQIELGDIGAAGAADNEPLTELEILLFKEKFNDEF